MNDSNQTITLRNHVAATEDEVYTDGDPIIVQDEGFMDIDLHMSNVGESELLLWRVRCVLNYISRYGNSKGGCAYLHHTYYIINYYLDTGLFACSSNVPYHLGSRRLVLVGHCLPTWQGKTRIHTFSISDLTSLLPSSSVYYHIVCTSFRKHSTASRRHRCTVPFYFAFSHLDTAAGPW